MESGGTHSPHPKLCSRWRWEGGFIPSRFSSLERAPYPFYRWVSWKQNILNILEYTKSLFLDGQWTKNVWTCSLYPSRHLTSSVAASLYKNIKISTASVLFMSGWDVQKATLSTPHSASPVWPTRWLTPTHKIRVTHREVIRLYGVCCRRYGWHPRPFWNAKSSYVHKLWSLDYHDAHVASLGLELFEILYYAHIIRRFAKLRKANISFVVSLRPSAWKNSAPTRRDFHEI
jgi:hypothetical protein